MSSHILYINRYTSMFDIHVLVVQTAKIYFRKRRKTEERTLPILITPFPASGSRDASKPLPGL